MKQEDLKPGTLIEVVNGYGFAAYSDIGEFIGMTSDGGLNYHEKAIILSVTDTSSIKHKIRYNFMNNKQFQFTLLNIMTSKRNSCWIYASKHELEKFIRKVE